MRTVKVAVASGEGVIMKTRVRVMYKKRRAVDRSGVDIE